VINHDGKCKKHEPQASVFYIPKKLWKHSPAARVPTAFLGILAELLGHTNCIPTWNRNMVALIAEKAEILKPSWVCREMNMRLLNIKERNELKEIIVTSKFVRDQI